jgi:EpsI family protein
MHLYLAIGLLFGTVLTLRYLPHAPVAPPLQLHFQTLPMRMGTWEGTEERLEPNVVTLLGLDDWVLRRYQREAGASVWFYAGFLAHRHEGKEHHSPQSCYRTHGWKLLHNGVQQIPIPGQDSINVYTLLVQKGIEQQWVLYWPQWGERVVTAREPWEEYKLKLFAMLRLQPMRTDHTLVLVSAPVVDSREATLAHAIAFIQAVFPSLSDLARHA